ncbi:MAG: type II toxin-antitoxin system Phd/YefM family antitoxin [Herbiconiux sp.]|uniref:type II toxin-antitoxin system Phd/YefM family antitoxin n=1 Tax=Herbiconiux sp. TaxID=1871186 RepID=UPI00121D6749|nr:type II toxin-antitoxin system Phd/YefM family antitoxin [Herbiconiux sp.]TAJ49149.1 MAG: type II toxin-antitoxin system Phd/YefM family antitoxin [Herbiconiux sp.]
MKTVALSEAKDKLSALVDDVDREHEIIRITRHGHGAAVLINEDDLESLHETLFWLSQPGIRDDLAEAREAASEGRTVGADDVRAMFGLPNA